MKTMTSLLLTAAVALAAGCEKKVDPRDRPGFVDTSDPGKAMGTMTPTPKAGNSGPGGVGAPGPGKKGP